MPTAVGFEGPEKLLEIWFAESPAQLGPDWPAQGLRAVPRAGIEAMLDAVNCKVLSTIESEAMDAYLLSESSLFVYAHKLVLKTCGTTATLYSLEPLKRMVSAWCKDLGEVYRVFYSRRTFNFPEVQPAVHQTWQNEVLWLNRYFRASTCASYVVGNLATDHWHLYINGTGSAVGESCDETLELLMMDLAPQVSKAFQATHYGRESGLRMMKSLGLDRLVPGAKTAKHDAYAFDPCGFSSNSILDHEYYSTLHVTPEQGWSYASFETNFPAADRMEVVRRVVEALQPGGMFVSFMREGPTFEVRLPDYEQLESAAYDVKFNYRLKYQYLRRIG